MYSDGKGFLRTKPFTFDGDILHVNADASKGKLRVCVVDEQQNHYAGFLSEPITSDKVDHTVRWPEGAEFRELQGKPVRLEFRMRNTHLYSFWID